MAWVKGGLFMARLGTGKKQMMAERKRRDKATKASLRSAGKALSAGSRSFKQSMRKVSKPKRTTRRSADPAAPALPLSPMARKVRVLSIVAAVVGGLLSLALPPLGAIILIAGIVAAVKARGIADRFFGGDAGDE